MIRSTTARVAATAGIGALALTAAGAAGATASPASRPDDGWRVVKRIAMPGRSVELFSIDADSRDDAWAAGVTTKDNGYGQRPLIEHWTGRSWQRVALPAGLAAHFGGDVPFGIIGASSSRDVLAFGAAGNSYLRLSGTRWSYGRLPHSRGQVFVLGVQVFGRRDAWAFGVRVTGRISGGKFQPYAARFDGTRWRTVSVPGHGFLGPVSAVSACDMWALETTRAAETLIPSKATLLHWNGRVWRRAAHQPSLPARGYLAAVLAEPDGAVWVGGSAPNSRHGRSELVERWNGRAWTNVSPPTRPSRHDAGMTALARAGRAAVWGVGTTLPLSARFWHYADGAWAAPVSPRWYPFWLAGVPRTATVWAVGSSTNLNDAVIAVVGPLPR